MAVRSDARAADADGRTQQLIHRFLCSGRRWSGAGRRLRVTDVRSTATLPLSIPTRRDQLVHFLSA